MKRWDDHLWLLEPHEFDKLDNGVILCCIDGEEVTKGVDYIDKDTRFGCMAFGFTRELVEKQNLDHEFLMLLLKSSNK